MAPLPRKSPYAFLPPLSRRGRGGTVARVQELIRDAIVRLDLPPGAFIDKTALCARLKVSRFPVSEALGRLAAEGLVEVLPQRGTRVARIRLAEAYQAMFIRRALEAQAVRALAPRGDAGLLIRLNRNLDEQEAAVARDDRLGFYALDLAFHDMLLDALGYERVKATVEAARANLDRLRLVLLAQRKRATVHEHRAIVAALARRDGEAAGSAMEAHLDGVMADLMVFADRHADAFETPARDHAAA
jgi:DNA-binding GntR family transcriptional regulator